MFPGLSNFKKHGKETVIPDLATFEPHSSETMSHLHIQQKGIFFDIYRDGELLLVDSGCEYNGYSSDTTRVWPVNGRFTKAQRELYEVMLNIQKNCIKVKKLRSLRSLNDESL